MTGLVGTFGNKSVAQSMAVIGLQNEDWQFSYKNGAPVLFADITGLSIHAVSALKRALEEKEVDFSERTRSSNQAEVIEVMGEGFSKLTKIIGTDKVNQMNVNFNSPHVNAVKWSEGMKANSQPVLYTDITDVSPEIKSTLSKAMNALDIEGSERVNSSGRRMLEVTGTSIPKLTAVLPRDTGNERALGMDG